MRTLHVALGVTDIEKSVQDCAARRMFAGSGHARRVCAVANGDVEYLDPARAEDRRDSSIPASMIFAIHTQNCSQYL